MKDSLGGNSYTTMIGAVSPFKSSYFETLSTSFDFNKKVYKSAWNPAHDCLVLASLNCLFIYNAL